MVGTATINVIDGTITIDVPDAEDLDIYHGTDGTVRALLAEIEPWGAEELGMERADAELAEMGWRRVTDWTGSEQVTCEVTAEQHHADVDWGSDRISIFATTDDGADEQIAAGDLEWVDPADDSPAADDHRRQSIISALAALGWEPIRAAEWQHIEGGLGNEAGAIRVPVRKAATAR